MYAPIGYRVDIRPVGQDLDSRGLWPKRTLAHRGDFSARPSARVRLLRQIGAAIHIGNAACIAEALSRPVGLTLAGASSRELIVGKLNSN